VGLGEKSRCCGESVGEGEHHVSEVGERARGYARVGFKKGQDPGTARGERAAFLEGHGAEEEVGS